VSESDLYGDIIGEHSHGPTRLFRQQSALAWAGKVIARTATTITLSHPHAIKIGTPGIADLGGFTSVTITPEMVGQTLAVAIQIECKGAKTRVTPEQRNFLAMSARLGVRCGIARNSYDARCIIYPTVTI
jgi:hypothetical protein